MIQTQTDIINEVLVEMNVSTTAGFYTDAILKAWYAKAHTWACGQHKWPFTEGKVNTTFSTTSADTAGNIIVPYPEGWKSDSVRILTIGEKRLQKLNYADLLRFKEDNTNNTARIFSDYGRQLYINSTADVSGTLTVYGQYTPVVDTTDDTANSIFAEQEGNEAIIEKMMSYMSQRERAPVGLQKGHIVSASMLHEQNAKAILDLLWHNIQNEQYGYQLKDRDMYTRFDVLRGGFPEDIFNRDQFGFS